jgi:hypothetical protein
MARGQFIHRFVPDINWPAHFPVANSFTWLALCLLAADAIVVAVRLRPLPAARSAEDDADEGAVGEAAGGVGAGGAAASEPADERNAAGGAAEDNASAEHGHGGVL